jgi:hypothetical protein
MDLGELLSEESVRLILEWAEPLKWIVGISLLLIAGGWGIGRARNKR